MEKLYFLKNDFGEYKELTKDENKIKMIYIDECNQAINNNIIYDKDINETKEQLGYIEQWNKEIEKCVNNEYTIKEIIEKLNKEHNWLIETYIREE